MPDNDDIHAAEVRVARAEARVEALERKAKRDKAREEARAESQRTASGPGRSRLARGLDATDPTRKEGRK